MTRRLTSELGLGSARCPVVGWRSAPLEARTSERMERARGRRAGSVVCLSGLARRRLELGQVCEDARGQICSTRAHTHRSTSTRRPQRRLASGRVGLGRHCSWRGVRGRIRRGDIRGRCGRVNITRVGTCRCRLVVVLVLVLVVVLVVVVVALVVIVVVVVLTALVGMATSGRLDATRQRGRVARVRLMRHAADNPRMLAATRLGRVQLHLSCPISAHTLPANLGLGWTRKRIARQRGHRRGRS